MKKKQILIFALILALSAALCGCGSDTPGIETPSYPEETFRPDYEGHSPIPNQRTGLLRQGITGYAHGSECTDTGIYFMADVPGESGRYLFYGDHGSDTMIKLCGRPDCDHKSADCNAYFSSGTSISYYNGYLYVAGVDGLVRLNLNGTDRVTIVSTDIEGKTYRGTAGALLWNGIFTVDKFYLDESGQERTDSYYYKLDGSMEKLELTTKGVAIGNDGSHFIVSRGSGGDFWKFGGGGVYLWEPDSKELPQYLTDEKGDGYYGAEDAYYIRDGVIYHLNYAGGQERILLNTGLEGYENLSCFPDCLVVSIRPFEQEGERPTAHNTWLYFYNWDFELLGQVELTHTRGKASSDWSFIVGETAERVILSDGYTTPRYYIEKSDFGTGHIEIHEYNMPDVDWSEIIW